MTIMIITDPIINSGIDDVLTIDILRHQESQQNKAGFGEIDTPLTPLGKSNLNAIADSLNIINPHGYDIILHGTLKRHEQSVKPLVQRLSEGKSLLQQPVVVPTQYLNAVLQTPLVTQEPALTQERYALHKFKPGSDGLYHAHDKDGDFSFNPITCGVFPFNPLYSRAYFDRRMRNLVFPDDNTLPYFSDLERNARMLHALFLANKNGASVKKPIRVLSIGSCSANGLLLEYAKFGTVGLHLFELQTGNGKPLFPQDHLDLARLAYTQSDVATPNKRLSVRQDFINVHEYSRLLHTP